MIKKISILSICILLFLTFSNYSFVEAKKANTGNQTVITNTTECILLTGPQINEKIMSLAGTESAQILTGATVKQNSTVKAIKRAATKTLTQNTVNISQSSTKPVYMWFDRTLGTIYWYSETAKPIMNSNSTKLFSNLVGLEDISGVADFDASKITSTYCMFERCFHLTDLTGVHTWNTASLRDMSYTFFRYYENDDPNYKMTNLNAMANWNVSNVTNMNSVFYGLQYITSLEAVSNWNTANVTNMSYAFMHLHSLESLKGLENWNTSKVVNMYNIFSHLHIVTDISAIRNWDVSSVTNLGGAMRSCRKLVDISPVANWNVSNVTIMGGDTYWGGVFSYDDSVTDFSPLANWNTSNVTNMGCLFQGCYKMTSVAPFATWNVSKVTYFDKMFSGCSQISNATALNNWNIRAGTTFNNMFNTTLQAYPQWSGTWSGGTFVKSASQTPSQTPPQTEDVQKPVIGNTQTKTRYILDFKNRTIKDANSNSVTINSSIISNAFNQKNVNKAVNVLKKGGITVVSQSNNMIVIEI